MDVLLDLLNKEIRSAGMMNYAISRIVSIDVQRHKSYDLINEAIGVLECCKQELYRRVAVPFEDEKCKQNGDVFNV